MKIKNKHIIHKEITKCYNGFSPEGKKKKYCKKQYLCICSYTKEKATKDNNKITCVNCLRQLNNKKKLKSYEEIRFEK